MTSQYACPVDGCDYTAGEMGSVKGHLTRSTSGGHEGLSGPGMSDEIDTTTVDDTDAVEQASEQTQTTDSETPQFPENPDSNDSNGSGGGETDEPPECPKCESTEIADASLVVDNQREQLSDEHVNLLQNSDYVCAHCGGVFDDD